MPPNAAESPLGTPLPAYTTVARNSAVASENKIHDDTVARQYGFAGGLVPGVTVMAYMVPPILHAFGDDWLSAGSFSARFVKPVYEGETARVQPAWRDAAREVELEVRNPAGDLCAMGRAALLPGDTVPPDPAGFADAALPAEREPVSEAALRRRTSLGALHATASREALDDFLEEAQDQDQRWRGPAAPVHPGYLFRSANTILSSNVRLNPWIHVSSEVSLLGTLRVGDYFETRGKVISLFERGGHRFVQLDVVILDAAAGPVMRIDHTAIYDIRRPAR